MPIWKQKLLARLLRNDNPDDAGGGGDNNDAALQREQELEASRQGWMPKHKFTGPPDQWRDAATFLRVGRETRSGLQSELNRVKQELEEFKGTAKQFAEFQQAQIESRNTEIAGLIKQLQREQRQAIRDGDDTQADHIDDRIDLLREEQANVRTQLETTKQKNDSKGESGGNSQQSKVDPAQGIDDNGHTTNPLLVAWINDGNQWMRDNRPMREYSFAVAAELINGGETRRGAPFLALVREKMEEAFPRYFGEGRGGNPNSRGSVGSSGAGNGGSGGHTEHDLPEADRQLMELGIRQGWTTKEKFISNYFSDGPRIHKTAAKK